VRAVGRFLFWSLIVVMSLAAALGALLFYFVYTPDPEVPILSGTFTRETVEAGGLKRTYRLYVPRGLAKGAPLVVVMHGSGGNGLDVRIETGYGFDRLADKHGFAVAYPNAHEGYWDECAVVGDVGVNGREIDDVGFITAIADRLIGEMGIDPDRVFATGISRGGSMSFRLALESPLRFRAVAAVAANIPTPDNFKCKSTGQRTSSVMIMNGTEDPLVPFDGGEDSLFGLFFKGGTVRSSRASGQYFADLNNIAGAPETSEARVADGVRVERVLWRSDSDVEVELVAVHGGGHGIPQPYRRHPRLLGPSPSAPNGPEVIWAFFDRQRARR
jgi:polyhydroxybutyrate depolymerase